MAKVKWGVTGEEVDNTDPGEAYEIYDGPVPPSGIYRLAVKSAEYTLFSTGSKGLKLLLIVDENRTDKKRYNGAPCWDNVIDLESTAFKIRQFVDAIGAEGKDWDNTVIDSNKMVTKFGRVKVEGLFIRAQLKRGQNQSGDPRLEVNRYLPMSSGGDEEPSGDDDGEEAPF